MSTSAIRLEHPRRGGAWSLLRDAVVPALSAAWTAGFAAYRLQAITPPGSHRLAQVLFYGYPLALVAIALADRPRSSRVLRISAAWCAAVAVAFLAEPRLVSSPKDALAVPALALGIALAIRFPALMVTVAIAVSSAFGDLEAYWHFPTQKVIDVVLVSLLVSVLAFGLARRRRAVMPRPLVLVLVGYLFVTAVMVPLAADRSIALHDFSTTSLYLITALVIAHAGWTEHAYDRIAKAVLAAALLVGAYATLRMVIGPSHVEQISNNTSYNYINGHFRAIGSMRSPQDLGLWTSAMIPFTVAWALGARGWSRLAGVVATVLLAVAMYGTGVRIGLLAAAGGIVVLLLLHHFARGFPGLRLGITLGAVLLAAATGAVLFTVVHSTSPAHNYSSVVHPLRDPSVIARTTKWSEAMRELRGRPFGFGMGSASYLQSVGHQAPTNIGYYAVDNGYLYVALEQGLAIMALFIAGCLALVVELCRGSLATWQRRAAMLGIGASGVLVSLLVSALAETPGQSPRLLVPCIAVGLGLAPLTASRVRARRS